MFYIKASVLLTCLWAGHQNVVLIHIWLHGPDADDQFILKIIKSSERKKKDEQIVYLQWSCYKSLGPNLETIIKHDSSSSNSNKIFISIVFINGLTHKPHVNTVSHRDVIKCTHLKLPFQFFKYIFSYQIMLTITENSFLKWISISILCLCL